MAASFPNPFVWSERPWREGESVVRQEPDHLRAPHSTSAWALLHAADLAGEHEQVRSTTCHWQTVDMLLRFVSWAGKQVNKDRPGRPWLHPVWILHGQCRLHSGGYLVFGCLGCFPRIRSPTAWIACNWISHALSTIMRDQVLVLQQKCIRSLSMTERWRIRFDVSRNSMIEHAIHGPDFVLDFPSSPARWYGCWLNISTAIARYV